MKKSGTSKGGRPPALVKRSVVSVYVSEELVKALDEQRGKVPRGQMIEVAFLRSGLLRIPVQLASYLSK